jgi:hypothetical protein
MMGTRALCHVCHGWHETCCLDQHRAARDYDAAAGGTPPRPRAPVPPARSAAAMLEVFDAMFVQSLGSSVAAPLDKRRRAGGATCRNRSRRRDHGEAGAAVRSPPPYARRKGTVVDFTRSGDEWVVTVPDTPYKSSLVEDLLPSIGLYRLRRAVTPHEGALHLQALQQTFGHTSAWELAPAGAEGE